MKEHFDLTFPDVPSAFAEHFLQLLLIDSTLMLKRINQLLLLHPKVDVKVHVLRLAHLNVLDPVLNRKYPSQEPSFIVVLCVLDYAPSEINSIDESVLGFEGPELESKNLSHHLNTFFIT